MNGERIIGKTRNENQGLTIISTYVDLCYGRSHTAFPADLGGTGCTLGAAGGMASRIFAEPADWDSLGHAVSHFDAAREITLAGNGVGSCENARPAAAAFVSA